VVYSVSPYASCTALVIDVVINFVFIKMQYVEDTLLGLGKNTLGVLDVSRVTRVRKR
jgi:hypothetical protein